METQAKRQYNQIAGELLTSDEEGKLGEKLETLRLFLGSADFNKLRSESEKYLLEGRKIKFVLYLEQGKPEYEMKVME